MSYCNPYIPLTKNKVNEELEILRTSIRHICTVNVQDEILVYSLVWGTSKTVEKYINERIKELGLNLIAESTLYKPFAGRDSLVVRENNKSHFDNNQ